MAQHDNHRTCNVLGTKPVLRHLDTLTTIEAGSTFEIRAEVFEPDIRWGDSLTYRWEVIAGSIKTDGAKAKFTAPDTPGPVALTLTVFDCGGNTIKTSYELQVTGP
jgi:hypothetical protein